MNLKKVKSTNIDSIGHDPEQNILRVRFLNGGEYNYHGISSQQYQAMLNSESIGSHLSSTIKPSATTVEKL